MKTNYTYQLRLCIIVIVLMFINKEVVSQINYDEITLEANKNFYKISHCPYSTVSIFDKRLDSLNFFTILTGAFPIKSRTLSSHSIKNFIEKSSLNKNNNTRHLILRLNTFKIPNTKFQIAKKFNSDKFVKVNIRDFIYLSVDFFYQLENGSVFKFAAFSRRYNTYGDINWALTKILSDIQLIPSLLDSNLDKKEAKLISKKFENYIENSELKLYNLSKSLKFSEILNDDKQSKKYDILDSLLKSNISGYYLTFEDFKNNNFLKAQVDLTFDKNDSSYKLINNNNKLFLPWCILSNNKFYIRLNEVNFIPLILKDNKLSFSIPVTFLDMYSYFSIEEGYGGTYIDSQFQNGRIGKNIERLLNKDNTIKKQLSLIKAGTLPQVINFRKCFIDFETGDFFVDDIVKAK